MWGPHNQVPGFQWLPGSPLPREHGATGDTGSTGVCMGAAGSTALLVVVGPAQELGRGVQAVSAPGPTGRKSLPACGGDSLAEKAPPTLLPIS